MKHICHISTTFNSKAGSTKRTYAIIRALASVGYKVTLITGEEFNTRPEWTLDGLNLIRVKDLVKYIYPERDVKALRELTSILKCMKPDVVHTHLAKAGVLGRVAARIVKTDLIVHTVHGPTFAASAGKMRSVVFSTIERICAKVATDYFVFVGRELAEHYLDAGVRPRMGWRIIHTGLYDKILSREVSYSREGLALTRKELLSGDHAEIMITYVGRLVASKRHEHAIEAVRILRDKGIGVHLVIVGEGLLQEEKKYEQELLFRVKALGFDRVVHFKGYRSDIAEIMAASDIVILTSKYEGLPNVAVEAGMVGKPMVAYEVGGIREVMKHGFSGYVVRQGEIQELADRLELLARDRDLRKRMEDNARRMDWSRYTREVMIERKLKFYEEILGS